MKLEQVIKLKCMKDIPMYSIAKDEVWIVTNIILPERYIVIQKDDYRFIINGKYAPCFEVI